MTDASGRREKILPAGLATAKNQPRKRKGIPRAGFPPEAVFAGEGARATEGRSCACQILQA